MKKEVLRELVKVHPSNMRKLLRLLALMFVVLAAIVLCLAGVVRRAGITGVGKDSLGINVHLPGAKPAGKKGMDKMAFYDQAQQDSIRLLDQMKVQAGTVMVTGSDSGGRAAIAGDSNLAMIKRQIDELRNAMHMPGTADGYGRGRLGFMSGATAFGRGRNVAGSAFNSVGREMGLGGALRAAGSERDLVSFRGAAGSETAAWGAQTLPGGKTGTGSLRAGASSENIERLERMMRGLQRQDEGTDGEMAELKRVLEGLTGVRKPERLRDSVAERRVAYAVIPSSALPAARVWSDSMTRASLWHDLDDIGGKDSVASAGVIHAIVPEAQTVVSGETLRMELQTELVLGSRTIPAGVPLYGVCRVDRGRMQVMVNAIQYKNDVYPVMLQVLDEDGMAGIRVSSSIEQDAVQETAGQAAGGLGLGGVESSITAQAAATGLQLARNLAGKKIRQLRVPVAEGYRVFLKDITKR